MSKRGYISRYVLIIKKLQQKPYSTLTEIQDYLEHQFQFLHMNDDNLNVGFSKRTLQRDIKEIANMFNISIEYDAAMKGYYILPEASENKNFSRMLEAFDMFQSLNLSQDLTPFVHLEKRQPQGTEHLYGLMHGIKNRYRIGFMYGKFYEDEPTHRLTEPCALKEFRNRWYLLAKDCGDGLMKTFALDRISELQITNHSSRLPADFHVEEYFRHCFGIERPNQGKPEEILLSFDPFQAKYIKTLPLHPTQEIVFENAEEVQIRITAFATHDLYMELMSMGDQVTVLAPRALAAKLREGHRNAGRNYTAG